MTDSDTETERIHALAGKLTALTQECVAGKFLITALPDKPREGGASVREAADYVQQAKEMIAAGLPQRRPGEFGRAGMSPGDLLTMLGLRARRTVRLFLLLCSPALPTLLSFPPHHLLPLTHPRNLASSHALHRKKLSTPLFPHAAAEAHRPRSSSILNLAPHYALVKKDQATARKPLLSEADWFRVFSAWQMAVEGVYPHRSAELAGYQWIVISLFRQLPHDPRPPRCYCLSTATSV
ncbi:hypothetical protein PLICRDRAFT_181021 [Plicaturopsis crispa FD-325 SS-3]|uniref:Uncharacterized protein n=1 Tax=Plicaturopsis crispa FD-325 SS-3 TaxID=944288 RepID=A0A0C9SJY6_PLICR|nr:hypothetical protein PLICRDRAFT_181021 [Plicaturopsis crispa FD-325 SS-3]